MLAKKNEMGGSISGFFRNKKVLKEKNLKDDDK